MREDADLRLGERLQQRGEHAGQREVERALDGERRERPGLLAPSSARCASAQTTLVSSAVAVIENSEDDSAQAGTSAPGPRRTTASFSGNCSRVNGRSWGEPDGGEAGLLGQAEREVHALHGCAAGALGEVVDGTDHDHPAGARRLPGRGSPAGARCWSR